MTDDKPETYLKKYKEIFERAFQSEELKKLLIHQGNDIGFASPLKSGRVDMQKDILFVGINPSYPKKKAQEDHLVSSSKGKAEDYLEFDFDLGQYRATSDGNSHIYFGKVAELAKQSNLNLEKCGYLDLFVFRKTNQKIIQEILKSSAGFDFIISQIEIFHEIVSNLIKPKLIVVLNAQAQGFLGLRVKYHNKRLKKENVWLGLQTRPTTIPLIKEVSGISPELTIEFNSSMSMELVKNKTFILPYTYLRYVSKDKIKELSSALQEFRDNKLL